MNDLPDLSRRLYERLLKAPGLTEREIDEAFGNREPRIALRYLEARGLVIVRYTRAQGAAPLPRFYAVGVVERPTTEQQLETASA